MRWTSLVSVAVVAVTGCQDSDNGLNTSLATFSTAAPIQTATVATTTGTPTTVTRDGSPAPGSPDSARVLLRTWEGWEYEIDVSWDGQIVFSTDVSTSPPGRALLSATITESPNIAVTPLSDGAGVPAIDVLVRYHLPIAGFAASSFDPLDEQEGEVVCVGSETANPPLPDPGITCWAPNARAGTPGVLGTLDDVVANDLITDAPTRPIELVIIAGWCSIVLRDGQVVGVASNEDLDPLGRELLDQCQLTLVGT